MTPHLSKAPPLYNPAFEHDGCGTGFVADIEGQRSHRLIELAISALVNLTHRGAVSSDAASGDGAGVTIQIPTELLADEAVGFGLEADSLERLAVAMAFLPNEEESKEKAKTILEEAVCRSEIQILGWRTVPINASVLGGLALQSLPKIEQLLMARPDGVSETEFSRSLYKARRRCEAAYRKLGIDAYLASMSSRIIVYKGLMVAPQLTQFFPDLEDTRTRSALALFHQRFATNTLPNWKLAQPFRLIAHNGEINTLLGNRRWMSAREPELTSSLWGEEIEDLIPVIWPIGSDTASLDEVLELLMMSGRDLMQSMAMLVPEAWENMDGMDEQLRDCYRYHACVMEPWDGPAALVFTDGRVAAAAADRNGLRPARYQITSEGLVIVSSEVGVLDLPMSNIVESGRVGAGEMVAVDTVQHRFLCNKEIKEKISSRHPYGEWVNRGMSYLRRRSLSEQHSKDPEEIRSSSELSSLQLLHGYTREEIALVIKPMALTGKEPVSSMGDDAPLSVLNEEGRLLYTYFRQRFAQVTNPPIDSIREKIVMSLDTYLGRRGSLLEDGPQASELLHIQSPVLLNEDLNALRDGHFKGVRVATLSACFPANDGSIGFTQALEDLCTEAEAVVEEGYNVLVVSDRASSQKRAPIPMLMAVSAIHHHLICAGQRMRTSIIAEAGDARDVHHFAALVGFGASAVTPYLAFDTVRALVGDGKISNLTPNQAINTYVNAVETGLLKVMSKMGISAITSYHGAQIFEALGLCGEVVKDYFPGTTSRIGGIGLSEITADVLERHGRAYSGDQLGRGGWYKYRRGGEYHANEPPVWRALHAVVQGGGRDEYQEYSALVHNRPATALRDLMRFVSDRNPIDITQVESEQAITRRFQTGAMSLGALSPEAHEDIARAMNRIGGLANTGEGGEDPRRYLPDGDHRDANSSIKQVASGRFGVTAAYLAGAKELEIKIAQGSKPGEGGQLPGHKVSDYIARLRHVNPGTPLISPPPHHDIYSIEDIAQLIYDLKVANPDARVCVKLVSSEGVGTIAAGVAKGYADVIQVSGADGGTGASPLSSVKYAGSPWELGLAETQQTLVMNGLRGRVTLATDGGLHTGRDVIVAALLGADRFGFGTAALVAVGCKMARQCHLNTCPVGIATQREELRKKYFGTPEMLIHFLTHVAQEVREILAKLGYESLEDLIGRADLLAQIPSNKSRRWRGVNLSKVMTKPTGGPLRAVQKRNQAPIVTLEHRILEDLGYQIEDGLRFHASYPIRNTDRTVGGYISGLIASAHGAAGLASGSIRLHFTGSAGQSFGAWLVNGVRLELEGEANDYVAKGMSGGKVIIRPPADVGFGPKGATLVGNTVLYGATGGQCFVAGRAGERFAVRNSGALAVVEGIGNHGCEYMTGGIVVILGEIGRNFGAGMSGGSAFVLDALGACRSRVNFDLVRCEGLIESRDMELLHNSIESHQKLTGSTRALEILDDWKRFLPQFCKVVPRSEPRLGEDIDVGHRTANAEEPIQAIDQAPIR